MTRAELPNGPTGSELAALSTDLGVVLVAGFCERTAAGAGPYNSALVLDHGELLVRSTARPISGTGRS